MADWKSLALAFIVIGFELDIFAVAVSDFRGDGHNVEALIISGFLAYLLAFMLIAIEKFGQLAGNRPALICAVVTAFAAGGLTIVGFALYASKVNDHPPPYQSTLLVSGAAFGLLGGLFALLDVCKC